MKMIGTIGSDGLTVTLTSGQLPAWFSTVTNLAGAQVFGYQGSTNATGGGGNFIASVASATSFKLLGAGTPNATNVRFVVSQEWTTALNRIQANMSHVPPLTSSKSVGVGYMGSDGWMSASLAPAGLDAALWVMDDGWWSTASGQARTAAAFVRPVLLQEGSGASRIFAGSGQDSLNWYTGGSPTTPTNLFTAPAEWSYGFGAGGVLCANEYATLVTGQLMYPAQANNPAEGVWWIQNIANGSSPTAPTSWQMELITDVPWTEDDIPFGNWIDGGDGYYYTLNTKTATAYVMRFPKADLAVGSTGTPSFARAQWWLGPGIGWQGGSWYANEPSLRTREIRAVQTPDEWLINGMGFYQKSDSSFVITSNFLGGTTAVFCNEPEVTGPYTTWLPFYSPSLGDNTAFYGIFAHPEQTWQGQTTDDMMFTIDTNGPNGPSDATICWPIPVLVSGI